jgi:hypothetical protein
MLRRAGTKTKIKDDTRMWSYSYLMPLVLLKTSCAVYSAYIMRSCVDLHSKQTTSCRYLSFLGQDIAVPSLSPSHRFPQNTPILSNSPTQPLGAFLLLLIPSFCGSTIDEIIGARGSCFLFSRNDSLAKLILTSIEPLRSLQEDLTACKSTV